MSCESSPLVSVIVPVYNAEQYLPQCIDGILKQTVVDIEVICIDDGSHDGSLGILADYMRRDKRIRVVRQGNSGQSVARNKGLDVARGKYIAFVDSDDFVEYDMLEKLVSKAESTCADIAIMNFLLYWEDDGRKSSFRDEVLYAVLRDRVFTIAQCPEMIQYVGVWDRLFSRTFIEKHGLRFSEGLVYEDHLFCIESEIKAERIVIVPDHLYYYRKNAGSSITDNEGRNDAYKRDFLTIHQKIQTILHQEEVNLGTEKCYADYFFRNALMHQCNIGDKRFFKTYFMNVRNTISPQMIEMGKTSPNSDVRKYSKCLEMGDIKECRRLCASVAR